MSFAPSAMLKTWLRQGRDALAAIRDRRTDAAQLLSAHRSARMERTKIAGINKPVSRLVLGCDKQRSYREAAEMFDDFFEHGGNAFDTAHIYGDGLQERLLGRWLENRSLREHVVVIGKGGHTPHCTPDGLTRQLHESLQRLHLDCVDLYLLHRDNPDVPVGDFIDVLNEHKRAGRITAFGASNWTTARMEAANDYAAGKGLTGFTASSSQFSLAHMLNPIWPGCLSVSDSESLAWHERTQMPLLAWSSLARGFFTERADPARRENEELVRGWYSPENFARRERAGSLAKRRGVRPADIALAYVLAQPFPTLALIGPRTIEQSHAIFENFGIALTAEDVQRLDRGEV